MSSIRKLFGAERNKKPNEWTAPVRLQKGGADLGAINFGFLKCYNYSMRILSLRFILICSTLLLLISVLSASFYAFIARASVYNLYSGSCLGGWENTHLASGPPQALEEGGAPIFTDVNSARLVGDTHAHIYCGGFTGDILEKTVPKKILVKFSWAVEYPKLNIETVEISEESATSTDPTDIDDTENSESENVENNPDEDLDASAEQSIIETETTQSEETSIAPEAVEPAPESEAQEQEQEQTEEPLPTPEPTPEPAPESELAPEEPTTSLLNFFAAVAYAQEITVEESAATGTESISDTANTTSDTATTTEATPYGLVEVMYTLDGIEWKSLGFVKKDEFGSKLFEIPIEEASEWEDISKIQIGVQSVPVLDGVAPIIYLDAVWIETEYEYENEDGKSQLANVLDAVVDIFEEESEEVIEKEQLGEENREGETNEDYTEEVDEVAEVAEVDEVAAEEEEEGEEEMIQEYEEPASPEPPLLIRNFFKDIVIDQSAMHRCEADPFRIDVSGRNIFHTDIAVENAFEGEYEMEIGGLPKGIDVTFSKNDDYQYIQSADESSLPLTITNQLGSQKGNFGIPLIYTKKGVKDSSVICQINIINQ
jgi:hypothetical protein